MNRKDVVDLTSKAANEEFEAEWLIARKGHDAINAESELSWEIARQMFCAGYLARRNDELNAKEPRYTHCIADGESHERALVFSGYKCEKCGDYHMRDEPEPTVMPWITAHLAGYQLIVGRHPSKICA